MEVLVKCELKYPVMWLLLYIYLVEEGMFVWRCWGTPRINSVDRYARDSIRESVEYEAVAVSPYSEATSFRQWTYTKNFENSLHVKIENYKEKLMDKTIALCENYVHNCSFIQLFTLKIFWTSKRKEEILILKSEYIFHCFPHGFDFTMM